MKRYLPHAFIFALFLILGFTIVGLIPMVTFLRSVGLTICLIVCFLVAEAAAGKKQAPKVATNRYVTVSAQALIRKGDLCTVDLLNRTVERAPTA